MPDAIAYRIALIFLILATNAFFAAAEVSLVSSRRFRLRALAEEGHVGAEAALKLLGNPERLLSVVQVGVTLASLGLGWAGEDTIFAILVSLLGPLGEQMSQPVLHGVGFTVAFLLMTFAHVVLGEVVPKNLAIEKSERLAVLVAPALLVFYRISGPFVSVIERSAAGLSRLLGLKAEPHGGGHSAEELRLIISSSRSEGHLIPFEEQAIHKILELQDYAVREVMVPRHQIVSVSADTGLDEILRVVNGSQYSRILVYQGSPEHIIGYFHSKDLLRVWEERRTSNRKRKGVSAFDLRNLVRKAMIVPESKTLNQMLDEFRVEHRQLAIVVDEFGTVVGLVTLEDVMEQVFGEIEDEYDLKKPVPVLSAPTMEFEGTMNIRDLENQFAIELPYEAGFETLAGFLLFRLGYIPIPGDSGEYEGRRFTIPAMDRNRIAKVRIEKLHSPVESQAPPQ